MTTSHHYVPTDATVLEDTVVGAGLPWSGRIDRGEHLVLVDPEGQQAIDFLCYNAHDPHERYHAPNTVKLQGNIYLGPGSVLWSVRARKMMTIVEDTCGGHDTLFGCCSFELDDVRYGQRRPPRVPAELRVRAGPPRARRDQLGQRCRQLPTRSAAHTLRAPPIPRRRSTSPARLQGSGVPPGR